MRLLFAGTPAPAVPALRALLDSPRHDVVAVLTRPDAPAGRGRRLVRSAVGALADEAGVPVLTPRRPAEPEFLDRLADLDLVARDPSGSDRRVVHVVLTPRGEELAREVAALAAAAVRLHVVDVIGEEVFALAELAGRLAAGGIRTREQPTGR